MSKTDISYFLQSVFFIPLLFLAPKIFKPVVIIREDSFFAPAYFDPKTLTKDKKYLLKEMKYIDVDSIEQLKIKSEECLSLIDQYIKAVKK